jgi:hypothetical protein
MFWGSECSLPHPNIRDWVTRSHPSKVDKEDNRLFTWAQAFNTASFSIVFALSLYSWEEESCSVPNLDNDVTSNCCIRLTSLRSYETPLAIHVLQTSHAIAVTSAGVSTAKAGLRAAPTFWTKEKKRWYFLIPNHFNFSSTPALDLVTVVGTEAVKRFGE